MSPVLMVMILTILVMMINNQREVNMTTQRYEDGVIDSDQSRIEP